MNDITPTPHNQQSRPRRNIDGIMRSGVAAVRALRPSQPASPQPDAVPRQAPQPPRVAADPKPSLTKLQAPLWTKYAPKPKTPDVPARAPVAKPRANARLMDVAAPAAARPKSRPKPAPAPTPKPQSQPRPAKPTPAVRATAPVAAAAPPAKPAPVAPVKQQGQPPLRKTFDVPAKPPTKQSKIMNILSYPLIVIGALVIGSVIYDQQAGQWLTIAFGVVALVLKLDSRYIFAVALACLGGVILSSVFKQDILADNFAVYAYLLLVFGTVAAMLELRRTNKYRTKKHKRQHL